jgi:fatty-acyl-CoA synthase
MVEPATLSALIRHAAEQKPNGVAVVEGERSITYAAFHELVQQAAAWLYQAGVARGSRIAIWLPNRLEWLVLLFAAARLGASVVAVNTRFRSAEVSYLLRTSGATWLFLQPDFRRIDFASVLGGVDDQMIPDLRHVVTVGAQGTSVTNVLGRRVRRFVLDDLPNERVDDQAFPDAPAIYYTTSGTTGGPKLVEHPQRSLASHAADVAQAFGLYQSDSRVLLMLPLCGTFGATSALAALAAGAPLVIQDAFDPAEVAHLLKAHAVTHTFGGDDMFARILEHCSEPRPFPAARLFGYAIFQPGALAFAESAWDRGVPIYGLYGSSELQALLSAQPSALPVSERIKGGGRLVSNDARVRVRDPETGALLPPGKVGEIEIRSPRSGFRCYLDNPQATAAATTEDGYFRTGDLGYARDDATFVFETRLGDAMRIGGFLVSPSEIEDVIKDIGGVADAQVVSVTVSGKSQPIAFVIAVPSATLTAEAVQSAAGKTMASFKVPARVWFVDRFPVTQSANGTKIQRGKLRDMALERLAKETASD